MTIFIKINKSSTTEEPKKNSRYSEVFLDNFVFVEISICKEIKKKKTKNFLTKKARQHFDLIVFPLKKNISFAGADSHAKAHTHTIYIYIYIYIYI